MHCKWLPRQQKGVVKYVCGWEVVVRVGYRDSLMNSWDEVLPKLPQRRNHAHNRRRQREAVPRSGSNAGGAHAGRYIPGSKDTGGANRAQRHITGGRIKKNRKSTLPHVRKRLEEEGERLHAKEYAASSDDDLSAGGNPLPALAWSPNTVKEEGGRVIKAGEDFAEVKPPHLPVVAEVARGGVQDDGAPSTTASKNEPQPSTAADSAKGIPMPVQEQPLASLEMQAQMIRAALGTTDSSELTLDFPDVD